MTRYDETDGWIFSDEYHQWQDEVGIQRREASAVTGNWRPGGEFALRDLGFERGLYGFKPNGEQYREPNPAIAAEWPKPLLKFDLDRVLIRS
jgi:hypothetical protein